MAKSRSKPFAAEEKDEWQLDITSRHDNRFICPTCKNTFYVDTWLGKPYWKFCPLCGKRKEVHFF
jgi:hypothetical protein